MNLCLFGFLGNAASCRVRRGEFRSEKLYGLDNGRIGAYMRYVSNRCVCPAVCQMVAVSNLIEFAKGLGVL